ncbi:SWI/SNF-related matrix-associated actin-dependent regulator of chromatin subfamily A-like protein 1 [Ciona intestinalis]
MPQHTEEQRKRIEENRLRALRIRSEKAAASANTAPVKTNVKTIASTSAPVEIKPKRALNDNSNTQNGFYGPKKSGILLKCTVIQGNRFSVTCPYNPKLVTIFKSIASRRYDPATKKWNFSTSDHATLASKVRSIGFQLSNPENAVIVKSAEGGSTSVSLDDVNHNNTKCNGKCYLISDTHFEVEMPYNNKAVAIFKSLPSKVYDINTRQWSFHLTDYNQLVSSINKEQDLHLETFPSTLLQIFKSKISGAKTDSVLQEFDLSHVDEKVETSLMPFQREGVNFALSKNGRILLADDMGLGKTVQSICIASYYRSSWPLLIICPSSVRLMWKESLLRWLPSQLEQDDVNVMLTGRDNIPTNSLVTVISYDLLTKHQARFEAKKYKCAIVDESHFIKNFKTARAKSATAVLKHTKHLLLLSGTPALSRPSELYTQISTLRSDLFPYFHQFGVRYCNAKQNTWGWDYSGFSNMTELRLILQETVMLRRTKDDVLHQLPPKLRRTVALDVSVEKASIKQRKLLEASQSAVNQKGLSAAEKHGILLQYFNETAKFKLPGIKSYVLDLLEGGHKFLLFAHHKSVLDSVEIDLNKKGCDYIRIDGSTPSERRQTEVARFQENSTCKVALLSITAANMGITLHSASLVVFAELFWNPGILVQAEDRCYRIGQRDVVNVHYLIAKNTADDLIWQMIKKKLEVLSKAGLNKTDFNETEQHQAKDHGQTNILDYFGGGENKSDCDVKSGDCDVTSDDDDADLLRAIEEAEREEQERVSKIKCHDTNLDYVHNNVSDTKQCRDNALSDVTASTSRLEQSNRKRENWSPDNCDFKPHPEKKRLKK